MNETMTLEIPRRCARIATACAALLFGCAPANTVPAESTGGATPTPEQAREQADPIPAGFGTLHQDQFTLQVRDGDLLIKVTPLEESVIRLAAPDTYSRLRAMADSRMEQARQAVYSEEPEMLLVSFFSYSPDTEYRPDDVVLVNAGRQMRPVALLPVTSGWGRGRLQQREIQNAIYVFDQAIDYGQPMTIRYGTRETQNWSSIIPVLERERARIRTER